MASDTSPRQLVLLEAEPSGARQVPERDVLLEKAATLAQLLSRELGVPVRLSVTDNRSTMVSFRRAPAALRLRLHHMFLDAPAPVVRAVADYAGRGHRRAGRLLDDFVRREQPRIRQHRDARDEVLSAQGRTYDLREIFEDLNERHFQGGVRATIGWGRSPARRRR